MAASKTPKRTHSEVEIDSSPEILILKRREEDNMATPEAKNSSSIQENFNSLATFTSQLQAIQQQLTDMTAKICKLNTIEQLTLGTKTAIQDLNDSLGQVRQLAQTAKQEVDRCNQLLDQLSTKTREIDVLKERMIQAESYSRRDNLIFEGIKEDRDESCEDKILDLLVKDLKLSDARQTIKFTRVHRLGGVMPNRSRPIIAKFHFYKDRQRVWDARRKLKGTQVWVSEDFPTEIRNRRQVLYPIYKAALSKPNIKASLVSDRLYINHQLYTVDTLHRLPECLHLENISLKTEEDTVFFYNRSSPLSNFYPAAVHIDGVKYKHTEQYYQCRKAEISGEHNMATQIMLADDPLTCKQLGDSVRVNPKWETEKVKVMKKASLHKYQQHEHLRRVLLSTGDKTLAEASPRDLFWGIGIPMRSKAKSDRSQWRGENKLGEVLMDIRDQLKQF